jgi:L-lactate dehydrogenase complex protein LldG
MSSPGPARDEILARIRAAIGDAGRGEAPAWDPEADSDPAAAYTRTAPPPSSAGSEEAAELFAQRCGAYRAEVTRCGPDDGAIAAAVAEICARHVVRSLAAPSDLPAAWRPDGVAVHPDGPPLALDVLDGVDGVLTGCAGAIANTGTIILDAGAAQGRRALTLVPDLHICVVRAAQIHLTVPEAVRAIADAVAATGAPITLISGPSATSDIELNRVEGVHGPRRLEVVLAG